MNNELAPIATTIVYEDEHVRVWNQVVPAGATIEKHVHENDYVLLNVAGEGPIDAQFHAGTGGELGEQLTVSPKPRTADFVVKGHIETARKDGDEYRAILVEFKQADVR